MVPGPAHPHRMTTRFDPPKRVVRDLHRDDLGLQEARFDAYPGCFRLAGGQPPLPDEAGVWHLALRLPAVERHGTGVTARRHDAPAAFARRGGARRLRLRIVAGNSAAERFRHTCGCREVRTREIANASGQPRTIRVLVKLLAAGTLADSLRRVPRDEPASTLP